MNKKFNVITLPDEPADKESFVDNNETKPFIVTKRTDKRLALRQMKTPWGEVITGEVYVPSYDDTFQY